MDDQVAEQLASLIAEQTEAIKKLTAKIGFLDETIQTNNAHQQDTQSKIMTLVTVLEKAGKR